MANRVDDDTGSRTDNNYQDWQQNPSNPKQQRMANAYGEKASMPPEGESRLKRTAKDMAANQATRAAVHGGLYAAEKGALGQKAKPLAKLAREELKEAEKKGINYNQARRNLTTPSWYGEQGKKGLKQAARGLMRRHKRALFVTLMVNVIAIVTILMIIFVGPFKHIHFETVLRSANFARFQLIVRKQFSAVIFNAAVTTQDSVGQFRNSPLVRQIRLAVPNYQLEQLGREGKVLWEFHPNSSFGDEVLPLRESLKAVIIEGQRFEVDQFARDQFGRNYSELSTRERWAVQNNFIQAVNIKLGDLMALMPRHVRWNPMFQLRQRTGIRLVKWLNAAREFAGKNEAESRALNAEQTSDSVMDEGPRAEPINDDFKEGAEEARQEYIDAAKEGRPPNKLNTRAARVASGARTFSDVVFATTAYCIARELSKSFASPEAQQQREAQAARMAANDMTTTDQIKAHDVTAPAVGAANGQWDAVGDIPDASESVIYKRSTGQDIPPNSPYQQQVPWLDQSAVFGEWQNEFEALSVAIDSPLTGLLAYLGIDINLGAKEVNDNVCKALLNQYVQYGVAAGEIALAIYTLSASKGITAAVKGAVELTFHFAVGLGLGEILNLLIEWTVKEYAGLYFTGLEQGADRFNTGYVAQNSIAQNSNRNVTYGRPLDQQETNEAQRVAMEAIRAEHQEKSFSHRYFAIDNPFSLTGLLVAKLPASGGGVTNTLENGVHFMGSILSSPIKMLGSLGNTFMPANRAHAENLVTTTTTFGVTQWGWSEAEQERIETDPSFSLNAPPGEDPPLLAYVEPRLAELDERYSKCYDPQTFVLQSDQPKDGTQPICTREFLSTNDALHWRYYKALMFAAKQLSGSIYDSVQ